MKEPESEYCATLESAQIIGASADSVRRWAREGKFRIAVDTGGRRLYWRAEIVAFARARRAQALARRRRAPAPKAGPA